MAPASQLLEKASAEEIKIDQLNGELTAHRTRSETLVTTGAEVAARLGELEAALATADLRLVQLENDIRLQEQARADAQSRRDVADSRAKDARYRLVEIDQQEQSDRQALATLGAKIEVLTKEHTDVERFRALMKQIAASLATHSKQKGYRPTKEQVDEITRI